MCNATSLLITSLRTLNRNHTPSGTRCTERDEDVKALQQPPNTKYTLSLYRSTWCTSTPLTPSHLGTFGSTCRRATATATTPHMACLAFSVPLLTTRKQQQKQQALQRIHTPQASHRRIGTGASLGTAPVSLPLLPTSGAEGAADPSPTTPQSAPWTRPRRAARGAPAAAPPATP